MNAEHPHEDLGAEEPSLWSALGLPEPQLLERGQAPPVDWQLLRRLTRQELPDQAARMTFRLIDAYPEWNEAHAQIIVEEFNARHPKIGHI
jgi:hypothetical protein